MQKSQGNDLTEQSMMVYFDILTRNELFKGIKKEELVQVFTCLGARVKSFPKGAYLVRAGESLQDIGVLLSGRAQITRVDLVGNRMIVAGLYPSDLFGESFACLETRELPVSVEAGEDCQVLWLNMKRVITVCSSTCQFHSRLIENMLRVLAGKNVALNEKVRLLSLKTTREKLLQYLFGCGERQGTTGFEIPYNRSELADFLGVDRSAMSRELSRMQEEGLLKFSRNRFQLLVGE